MASGKKRFPIAGRKFWSLDSGILAVRRDRCSRVTVLGVLVSSVATCIALTQSESPRPSRAEPGYVGPEVCVGCHKNIWDTYRLTGMGRSFYQPLPTNTVEDYTNNNTFYHKASDSYFTMLRRGDKYYQRRYQIDSDGKQANVVEEQVDFIMGSGRHSRTYLHKTARNTLIELPLAWYAENGGYWAMNPGYDRPDHPGFRRTITYDCMFCHNAYPRIPVGNDQPFAEPVYSDLLPEGIDCQRCHGPGGKHAQLAKTDGVSPERVRNAIVNPSRLSAQRQMEVCMQCHLETTSFPLPNSIQRYERGPFSYRPGQPLSAFMLFFDHATGKGRDDKFEIVNAAYRLRRSACFIQSNGKLLCTTCHNPHDSSKREQGLQRYNAVCRECHGSSFDKRVASGSHPRTADCVDCHMPKRRTEDVVHVVMTDHYIQRYKPVRDLLAEVAEHHEADGTYRGEVVLYYPKTLPRTPEDSLYIGIAQVIQKSNLEGGIAQLTKTIEQHPPERAEYYLELAEAWRNDGHLEKALALYKEAVRRNPTFVVALQKLGTALRRSKRYAEAAEFLERAASAEPNNAFTWYELGLTYQAESREADAVAAFEKAIELDPDMSEAQNNLGVIWSAGGELARAETAFREAIRIQPDYADAHGNLANLLAGSGNLSEAVYHFQTSLRLRPNDAATRYNFAMALGRMRRFDEAQRQLEASLEADPTLLDAHEVLADLLMAEGQVRAALPHYSEVLRMRPDFGKANLGLALALVALGDVNTAIPHLKAAAADSDTAVRDRAAQILRQLGK